MRMIERRIGTDAHEFARADFDDGHARIVLKVRNDVIRHSHHLEVRKSKYPYAVAAQHYLRHRLHHTERCNEFIGRGAGFVQSATKSSCEFDTILPLWESPSFVGEVVSEKRHTISSTSAGWAGGNRLVHDFAMRASWRIGWALAGVAASAIAFAVVWPRAHEATALLLAQDDPAELSDLQLEAALRNHEGVIAENVTQALDARDADLAKSFTDLATGQGHSASARDGGPR